VGNVPDVDGERPVQSFMRLARELGPLFRMQFPGNSLLAVSSHALVDEVCDESRFDKYLSSPLRNVRDFVGDGLFTAHTHEPNWQKAHRLLTPAFGPLAMKGYFEPMLDVAETMLDKWARLGPDADLDVPDNMTRLTLDTIALCGFDYRFNSFYQKEMHPFVDAMVRSLAEAGARGRRLSVQTRLMLMTQAQYRHDVAHMNEVVDRVIAERKASPRAGEQKDLLGLMLNAVDPVTGERLSDLNIRYQIITFLIAGHETTSGLLSFTLYQLLRNPHVLARATEEADRVLGDARPTFEHLRKLPYTDQVLRESLRVWPTAPAFAVYPKEDTVIGGQYAVRQGECLMVLIPELHRDPAVWKAPERFDPDRFSPENAARIPTHAFKPFGNGQRACIGRQFAMQEATLLLAMMLRRFELVDHHRYELKVKETLTLKPDDFHIRVRVRPHARASVPTAAAPAATAPAAAPSRAAAAPVAAHGTPLLVLFGSNTGSAEAFARRLAGDAAAQGYAASVAPMDAHAGRLPREGAVVLVTASYNGRPPDNAKAFCDWLTTLEPGALAGVRYTVFGCGSRDWAATYQAVPTRVDAALEAAGATRLLARGEADGRGDFFGDFDAWHAGVWPTLAEAFGVAAAEASAAPRYRVERADAGKDPLVEAHAPLTVEVLENRELVDMASPFGRSKRELVLRLPEGVTYRAGDHLQVLAENAPALVERAARRFGLSLDEALVVRRTREEDSSLPVDRPLTVRQLLSRYVELAQPATRKDVALLARHTQCPPEKRKLLALAGAPDAGADLYKAEVLDKRVSVLELLERFAACELPFAAFLELLPAMKPRRYSLSSSPRVDPTRATLTVALLDAPALSGNGRHQGLASSFLARVTPGTRLLAAVRPPHAPFFLPEDPATPVVMIAAGTGMAPFRGFVEERAAQRKAGARLGEAHLFFGCDHPDVDLLYRRELEAWQREGVVQVHTAFFRQPDGDVTFVQHRLWAERERVKALLDAGARFYVCGDGRRMAPAVRETLGRIHQERSGCNPEQAEAWLQGLEQEGRYLADVFAG
jgi:cytochrome P450/NADPH-cytochrome P450 reductase